MKKNDWVGKRFDMLTILEELPDRKLLAKCDCGVEKVILRCSTYGKSRKSCGGHGRVPQIGDLSGQSFNALTIIEDFIIERRGSANKNVRYCKAKCRCGKIIKAETSDLINGHTQSCGCVNRYALNMRSTIFQDKNEETMYWGGIMASDGNIHKSAVSVGLKESDVDHLYKLKEWLGAETKIYYKAKTKSYCFRVKNQRICEDLLEYGVTPNKSLTYDPPLFCEQSPDFWRGMIDGDGHIGKTRPVVSLFGTKMACDAFSRFVSTFCDSSVNTCKHNNIFSIRYSGYYAVQIMQKLYGSSPKFYLERKYELALKHMNEPIDSDFQTTYAGIKSDFIKCVICENEFSRKGMLQHHRWCKIKNAPPLADDNIII